MSEADKYQSATMFLLKGKFPDIKKMSKQDVLKENEMWRNIWSWIPPEVKYYVAKTGQQLGLTLRNYKRYLGVLLATYWDLTDVELGVTEKVYDQTSGEYFYEQKVVKVKISNLVDVQWLKWRKPESEIQREIEAEQITESEVNEDGKQD